MMNSILLILFIISTFLFGFKYFFCIRNIKKINSQIQFIYGRDTQTELLLDIGNREFKLLINSINRVISKYQKAECTLKENDKIFRETITNLSHDIRTPLTVTNGYLQLLEEENLSDKQITYVSIAKDRMLYLKELLEQLFEFACIEADELKLDFKLLNVYNILRDIIAMYYSEYENIGGITSINIPDAPCLIWADENAVKRIISNVICNSMIHGEGGYSVLADNTESMCSISISNISREIKENELEYIFERLYTADKARAQKRTGLGLAIAKKLVEIHGGEITAAYGNGRFEIKINLPV